MKGKIFNIIFTPGSLEKGQKLYGEKEGDFLSDMQEKFRTSNISAIYDWDKNEPNSEKGKRAEIRLIVEDYSLVVLCRTKAKEGSIHALGVLELPCDAVKNYSKARKLDCGFSFAQNEKPNDCCSAAVLINFLKNDFEMREQEIETDNIYWQGNRIKIKECLENARAKLQQEEQAEIENMQELIFANSILRTQQISLVIKYIFKYADANSDILIGLPWIRHVAFGHFGELIESALRRGVRIFLRYGCQEVDTNESNKMRPIIDSESSKTLKKMQDKYDNLKLFDNANDHSKLIIWRYQEVEWLMIGSCNFLSFYPRDETSRGETMLITDNVGAIEKCKKIIKPE